MPFDILPLPGVVLPDITDFGDPGGLQIYPLGGGLDQQCFSGTYEGKQTMVWEVQ